MSNFLNQAVIRYNTIAKARPLTTNAVLGFIIAGVGDIACQLYLEKKQLGTVDQILQSLLHQPLSAAITVSSTSESTVTTTASNSTLPTLNSESPPLSSNTSSSATVPVSVPSSSSLSLLPASTSSSSSPPSSSSSPVEGVSTSSSSSSTSSSSSIALSSTTVPVSPVSTIHPDHGHGISALVLGDNDDIADDAELWNARRTVEMSVIRAVIMAPFLQLYFPWLSRLVPGTTMPQVFKRVLADQLIGAPVSISLIFLAAATIRGDPANVVPRIQEQLIPTWQNGASYWPFIHSLNFKFVPVMHQPVVAHIASIWWNVVLSYRANIKLESNQNGTGKS